jgi:hypothetical protein
MFNAENHSIICSKIGGQRTLMSMYSAIVCLTRTHTHTHTHVSVHSNHSKTQPVEWWC